MADQNAAPPQTLQLDQPATPAATPATGGGAPPQTLQLDQPATNPSDVNGEPSLMDKISDGASKLLGLTPIGDVHRGAQAVQNWADQKMQDQTNPAKTPNPDARATFGYGALRDTAGLLSGATSPAGVATAAATIAAPEIVGPALIIHGVHNMIQGWGDLRNPDVLQNELNSGAEVAGGAATTGEAWHNGGGPAVQALRKAQVEKTLSTLPDQQLSDFKKAIPASKTAPYSDADVVAARPYLLDEHNAGNAIDSPLGLRDAADAAVEKIENTIAEEIKKRPEVVIKTNPIEAAKQALLQSERVDFPEAGLKELERFRLGWDRGDGAADPPLTLQRADDIRAQLNQENKAVLMKNNYDLHTARSVDPGFAAREAAAESLRNGIYNGLKELGFTDAEALRHTEGSLLKIRNASLKQEFNGEKTVAGTEKGGATRKAAGKVAKVGIRGGAAAVGAHVGGPLGAGAADVLATPAAEAAERAIAPGKMTKNDLIQRSFTPAPVVRPVQVTGQGAAAGATGTVAAHPETNRIFFRASDGSMHSIPGNENALAHARHIDPNLEVVPSDDSANQ